MGPDSRNEDLVANERLSPPVDQFLTQYESELGIPRGFMVRLLTEPGDWSFVIKLHGLIEAAMAAKVLEMLRRPELAKPIRRLQMRSLTSFAEALGATTPEGLEFLNALGELRNRLVHDVAQTGFMLALWAQGNEGASKFVKMVRSDVERISEVPSPLDPYRFFVWARGLGVLATLQGATANNAEAFYKAIEAEVSRRAKLEAEITQAAIQRLLAEDAQPPGPDAA